MNAAVRLTHYLERNRFPNSDDLKEHLEHAARDHTQALENLGDEDEVARGWRSEFIFRGRLGLSPDMHGLIDEEQ